MGILDVLTRVQRMDEGVKDITIEDSSTEPSIIVDSELSAVSENPVQNKVITNAISSQGTEISQNTSEINSLQINKIDKSPYIRKIHIGSTQTPDASLGEDGDLYIYLPPN